MSQMTVKGFTCELDQRPYGCSWESCNKDFKRKSDLTRHYKIHTNDRPHPCTAPGCGRQFIQRSALVVHTRTHTGEKPHKCQYTGCMKRFSDSSSLARHRHIHSKIRSRKCAHIDCPRSFCREKSLTKQKEQLLKGDSSNVPKGDGVSDSESCQSPSTPAQPATPQPLRDNMVHEVSILQESIFERTTSIPELDDQIHNYCMDEPPYSPLPIADDFHDILVQHRFSGMSQQQFLFNIGQGNPSLETTCINRSSQYHDLTEQVYRPTVDMSCSTPGFSNAPHSSATSFSSASNHSSTIPEGCYKYQGLHNADYPLQNASPMGPPVQAISYYQQLAQVRQEMLIPPGQIPNHVVGRCSPPPTLIKSDPWHGYESYEHDVCNV
ncbi:hypothetical protein V8C37DRAFT_365453 [Trichoderma ceciliae]